MALAQLGPRPLILDAALRGEAIVFRVTFGQGSCSPSGDAVARFLDVPGERPMARSMEGAAD